MRKMLKRIFGRGKTVKMTPAVQESNMRTHLAAQGLPKAEIEKRIAQWKKDREEHGFP